MRELSIIEVLSRDISRGLTINKLSKIMRKSYAFTNNLARELIYEGVLNKLVVGNAILCTLNLENELTRSLLSLVSVRKKQKSKVASVMSIVKDIREKFTLECAYVKGKELVVVCRNLVAVQEYLNSKKLSVKVKLVEADEFEIDAILDDVIVLYGFEKFWEMISNA